MKPINFPESTGSLAPPKGVSSEDCHHLPIRRVQLGEDPSVMTTLTSVWEPTHIELIALKSGGKIEITLVSETHPMMSVGVYRPR